MYALMSAQQPMMLVGPLGTGKTSVAQSVFNQFDKRHYSILTINMSSQVNLHTRNTTLITSLPLQVQYSTRTLNSSYS